MTLKHPSGVSGAPAGWRLNLDGEVIVRIGGRWVLHSECTNG